MSRKDWNHDVVEKVYDVFGNLPGGADDRLEHLQRVRRAPCGLAEVLAQAGLCMVETLLESRSVGGATLGKLVQHAVDRLEGTGR